MVIRHGPRRIIFVSCGFGMLQMVLEPDTERCGNKDVGTLRGVDFEIPRQLEGGTKRSL